MACCLSAHTQLSRQERHPRQFPAPKSSQKNGPTHTTTLECHARPPLFRISSPSLQTWDMSSAIPNPRRTLSGYATDYPKSAILRLLHDRNSSAWTPGRGHESAKQPIRAADTTVAIWRPTMPSPFVTDQPPSWKLFRCPTSFRRNPT